MKIAETVYAIDANVILRYLLGEGGAGGEKAARIMEALEDGKISVWCDPVTLAEVVWVLTSFYRREPAAVGAALLPIVRTAGLRLTEKERYVRALELFAHDGVYYGDACACATAQSECGGRLLSSDRKLSKVEGITRLESI